MWHFNQLCAHTGNVCDFSSRRLRRCGCRMRFGNIVVRRHKASHFIRSDFQFCRAVSLVLLLMLLLLCCCCGCVSTTQSRPFFSIGTIKCINERDESRARPAHSIQPRSCFSRYRTKDSGDEHVDEIDRRERSH